MCCAQNFPEDQCMYYHCNAVGGESTNSQQEALEKLIKSLKCHLTILHNVSKMKCATA